MRAREPERLVWDVDETKERERAEREVGVEGNSRSRASRVVDVFAAAEL